MDRFLLSRAPRPSVWKCAAVLCVVVAWLTDASHAQITADALGSHDMGPHGQAPTTGALSPCQYCHAPHSGISGVRPLWSQKLSTQQNYTLYNSPTLVNTVQEPSIGSDTNLCLSCHDGTVAPGQTMPYGTIKMSGTMNSSDLFGNNLSATHPLNFKLPLSPSTPNVYSSVLNGSTANPKVKMIKGNVQCTTCHEPHVEAIDPVAKNFLVLDNNGSAICLACHPATPAQTNPHTMAELRSQIALRSGAVTTNIKSNIFSRWSISGHAVASHKVSQSIGLGPYGNTRQNGCLSCHALHNGQGGAALLTGPLHREQNMDAVTQNCMSCHDGGSTISPALPNIFAEFAKPGHPFQTGSSKHGSHEDVVLNNNRHATCVDCHEPHSSSATTSFLATTIRPSEEGAMGVSAADGITAIEHAADQYEICLRCHGTSAGKRSPAVFGYLPTRAASSGDVLNIIPQFSSTATSSHPVMHDSNSALPQPSLLKYLLNLDGHTQGRPMGTRLLCTDCHNSDDNREFGGSGPSGPHGSRFSHILERRYEFSQVTPGIPPLAGPGTTIQTLLPPIVDPAAAGPYSLCAKCHDLSNILSNASFRQHSLHIAAGFSCSVCHTAHGMTASSDNSSGVRMVSFDLAVVAPNDSSNAPISYNRANNTCTLKCHNFNHNADGSVHAKGGLTAPARH
jgi:predicted CXXCH cytochrome family protein